MVHEIVAAMCLYACFWLYVIHDSRSLTASCEPQRDFSTAFMAEIVVIGSKFGPTLPIRVSATIEGLDLGSVPGVKVLFHTGYNVSGKYQMPSSAQHSPTVQNSAGHDVTAIGLRYQVVTKKIIGKYHIAVHSADV